MIRFLDGPANEVMLMLARAPLYLRAVFNRQASQWDALDQLVDKPAAGELIVAYRRVSDVSYCWMDWTEGRRRRHGRFASATYEVVEDQPTDEVLRNTAAWRAWCYEQLKRDAERGAES